MEKNECFISVGIPLYRSKPFLENIRQNCRVLILRDDIEIIISDRHCMDDTLDKLENEWGDDVRFRFFKSTDRIPWTQHLNHLLSVARGKYFRWMPHDDVFPEGNLELLIERLETDPNVILAYGATMGIDIDGQRLPARDRINTSPVQPFEQWQFQYSLDLFWKGYCDGAFKGLFRREPVTNAELYIRNTYELVGAERAWLFGLSLLGGLGEVPDSIYQKRFHTLSTHAQWRFTSMHQFSIIFTMSGYLWDYGSSQRKIITGIIYLWRMSFNALLLKYRNKIKIKDARCILA